MGKVVAGITMSMDGFVTGPNDRLGAGLGDGGERLHYWVFGGPWRYGEEGGSATGADRSYIEETFASGGACLVGRKMHDVVNGWGDDPGFGVPVFVVTHRPTRRPSRVTRHSSSSRTGSTSRSTRRARPRATRTWS